MKTSNFKADQAYARQFEKTIEGWYASLPFISHFWREYGVPRQLSGVDVNFTNGNYDKVWTIDEKVSKFAKRTGNLLYETWQHDDKPGWGPTATCDVVVYCADDFDNRNLEIWWVDLAGLRIVAENLPEKSWDFQYANYVRHIKGKLVPLVQLANLGHARGPYIVPYADDVP